MSDYKFNFRIGKLHIVITVEGKLLFLINDYHTWLGKPMIQLHEWRFIGR